MNPEDLCPRPEFFPPPQNAPLAPPLYPAAVYRCDSPEHADDLAESNTAGFMYGRDGHPNAEMLAEKCRLLHQGERAIVCGSGMSAIAAALLAQLHSGDHVILSRDLYGRSLQLITQELARWQLTSTTVDTCDLEATAAACTDRTRLIVAETISNPRLRVADIPQLAELAHQRSAELLIDNTFAGPTVFRPLEYGADWVVESLTKIMSGHSDVTLGLLVGREKLWSRVTNTVSVWGLASHPFDCWLALRGISTLALRAERANANAMQVAEFLQQHASVEAVDYPGLSTHPDHALAKKLFAGQFGTIVTFHLAGGREATSNFIRTAKQIPFSPSLGDLSTTLSHPSSTSHRGLSEQQRQELGIQQGTIRLSVGIESAEAIRRALEEGLGCLSRPT